MPEGATMFEAENINTFYDIAVRHAENWYEYMFANRSRDVPNGSLYLVTSCIKTGNWGIGALYGQPADTDYLEFTSGDQYSRQPYRWKKSGPILTKVGPTSTDIVAADGEEPNQCIFLRGYKITLGGKLWKGLKGKALLVPSNRGQYSRTPRTSTNNSGNQHNANQCDLPRTTGKNSSSGHVANRYDGHGCMCAENYGIYASCSEIPGSPTDQEPRLIDLENSGWLEGKLEQILLEEFFSVASPVCVSAL